MNIPKFMRLLADSGKINQALQFVETEDEVIELYRIAGYYDDAQQRAKAYLDTQHINDIEINHETVTVYCGPFTGYHSLSNRSQSREPPRPSTVGSYVHDPSGVEFEAECPRHLELTEYVRDAMNSEPAHAAAKAAYRSTRL